MKIFKNIKQKFTYPRERSEQNTSDDLIDELYLTLNNNDYILNIIASNTDYAIKLQGVEIEVYYNSERIGYAFGTLEGDIMVLNSIAISREEHQKIGLGRAMLKLLEHYARKIQVKEIKLTANAFQIKLNQESFIKEDAQYRLEKFYEKQGYEKQGYRLNGTAYSKRL